MRGRNVIIRKESPASADTHKEVNEFSGKTGVAEVTPVLLYL